MIEATAGYIATTLLQGLVIPGIAKKLASRAAEKGARLKDIEGPHWLRQIGTWLDAHQVSSPAAIKGIINGHQEEILRVLEAHEGELSELGKQIFDSINELKERIDSQQLTDEDKVFLAEIKQNLDPEEFEKRAEKLLQTTAGIDTLAFREELTTFFNNMGWGDKLDIINSKLDLVLENLIRGIKDIQERLELIEKSTKITIRYLPETPPDVSEFVDRKQQLEDLRNSLNKKNTIVIQGIAGIGKTLLAAKLKQNLDNDYTTFWKELHDFSSFDSVTRALAGFLRDNGDPDLAEYIEGGDSEHETIIDLLIKSFEKKNYVLFFDNYHEVVDQKIHKLFEQFKNRLIGSTIVITTRNPPPFVSPIDYLKNQITGESLEGFDLDATKEYLDRMGLEVSPEQLLEIDNRMNGHPLSLLMFVSLAIEMGVEKILENLPETGIDKYLYNEIYQRLNDNEQRVIEAISVFRTPFASDACVSVARGENVKKTLRDLEEKLLIKRKDKLYYLHDLVRELSYNLIDNPREYHRRAGEYYAQLERTPENILETTYHMIKDAGAVNDEAIDYLMGAPQDKYTRFVILGILDSNKIDTKKSFELFEYLLKDDVAEIQSYAVDILAKNKNIDIDKTLNILNQVINEDKNPYLTKRTIQSLSNFEAEIFTDVIPIISKIIKSKKYEYYWSVLVLIKDLDIKGPEIIEILKDIATSQLTDLQWYNNRKEAFELLKERGIALFEAASQIDYLHELRQMTIEQALEYLKRLAYPEKGKETDIHLFGFDHNFLFFILRELYKVQSYETSILMKHFLATLERNPFQHLFEILGEHRYFDREIIQSFLESDNRIVSLTGFMALEYALNKVVDGEVVVVDEKIRKEILELLKEVMTWKEEKPLIAAMAKVTYEAATNPTETENVGLGTKLETTLVKGAVEILGPRMVRNFMTAADSECKEYNIVLYWSSYRGILYTKPGKLREVFRVIGKGDDMFLRICDFMYDQLRISPEGALDILYKFALRSKNSQVRVGAVDLANIVGRLAPAKVLEIYEKLLSLPEYRDNRTRLTLTHNHRNFLQTSRKDEAQKNLKILMNDEDCQVAMLADIVLNGIRFREVS
jgi:hypothetical protein